MQTSGLSLSVDLPLRRHDSRIATLGWLVLALATCLALDTFHLGRASLWTDEVFSRYYYDVLGLPFLLGEGLHLEPTPPTYSIILRGWIALFGDSEAALRSLSVVSDAACLPMVYLLCRELTGRREALLAALLFALSPTGLYFAQEARVYAMTLLPACTVLFGTAMFVRHSHSRVAAVAYVLGGTLCLYLHATLVFLLASCALAVAVVLLLPGKSADWRALLRWIALNTAVLVLALPYLVHLLAASKTGGLDWIAPLGPRAVVEAISAAASGILTPFPWPAAPIAAGFLLVLAVSTLIDRPSTHTMIVVILIPCLFVGLVTLVSIFRPILLPRVLCWAIIPLCALTARQMLHGGRFRAVVIAATVVTFGVGLVAQETTPNAGKEPWRDVFENIGLELTRADLVVLSPRFDPLTLKYYSPAVTRLRMWDEHLPPTIMTSVAERLGIAAISRQEILQDIASGQSVWIVSNAVDMHDLDTLQAATPAVQKRTWLCRGAPCIEAMGWTAPK